MKAKRRTIFKKERRSTLCSFIFSKNCEQVLPSKRDTQVDAGPRENKADGINKSAWTWSIESKLDLKLLWR